VSEVSSNAFQNSVAAAILLLTLSGCGRKPDVDAAAAKVEKAFPAEAQAAQAAPEPAAPVPDNAAPAAVPQGDINASVKAALAAVHSKDYGEGVIAVQNVQQMPGVTANQLMALERAKQAMVANLQERAEQGDAKAKADLQRIERTRSQ
jgi:hypothetical protein